MLAVHRVELPQDVLEACRETAALARVLGTA
jgi:hypothetical protein